MRLNHTANAADADLYFTPRDGYGTYSVVFKMRDSSVFGDGMIARAGFSPPTKQTLTVHARPIIQSVFAGHRPDRSNHASTVGLTHLPLQSTVIQLTVTARHDLVLTRAVLASNYITVAQINAPPGIIYRGFADYLQRLIPPNADHPPDGGRINIVRLGPQSGQDPISPTGQTFTLIMTARIGNNVGPEVATVRMEVKFEQELAVDFVAPDSTDGTGDPKTLLAGGEISFHRPRCCRFGGAGRRDKSGVVGVAVRFRLPTSRRQQNRAFARPIRHLHAHGAGDRTPAA